jgi:DNA invertase Pin-like site-specific DNA recombinase
MKTVADFDAADILSANRFTIHVIAAVAEHERKLASQWIKDSLVYIKLRGRKFGSPLPVESLAKRRGIIAVTLTEHRDTWPVIRLHFGVGAERTHRG